MKILNLILFNLLVLSTIYAQNDYQNRLLNQLQNEYGLSGGTFVFGDSEIATFNAFSHFNGGNLTDEQQMTVTEKNIANQTFTKAYELNTPVRLPDGLNTQVGSKIKNQQSISEGDSLLLVFWARGVSDFFGFNGMAKVQLQGNEKIYKRITYFNNEWTQYIIPIKAEANYGAGELAFSFSFGYRKQTVQFGGVALIKYNSTNRKIPDTLGPNAYQGISPTASWRTAAQNRIENIRKADLQVKVVDQNNNPINGASVEVDMQQHHFGFGTAINLKYLPEDNNSSEAVKYKEKLYDLDGRGNSFNEVVFENAIEWKKWEEDIPLSKEAKIEILDNLIDKNIKVRGHSLLWPRFDRLPDDMEANQNNSSYLKDRIREHIKTILQDDRLAGKFIDWDAINEITNKRDIEFALGGRTFYREILEEAKQYAPNTPMYLNDYMTISYGGIGEKYDVCKNFLKEIDDAGAPFDGIGFQAHLRDAPIGIPTVYSILEDFNQTFNEEKDFKITEFDMREEMPSIENQYMKDFLTICFSHEKVKSFISWGFWDGEHWKNSAPFFDEDWNLKPGGQAFIDLVFNEWWTNEEANSNGNGLANFRPFKGKHAITVEYDGLSSTKLVELSEDKSITIQLNIEVTEPDPEIPEANIYYVSYDGDNSNDGTEANPWETIQHAADIAKAGDKVIIKEGVYEEYVKLKKSGTANKYITFIGEDRDEVILQGNPNLKSAFESGKSSYIRIEQMTIQDYHEEGIGFNNTGVTKTNIRLKNLTILNSGYNRGSNCEEYTGDANKCWDHGIRMANVDNFTIDNCYIKNSWGNNIHVHECKNGAVINCTTNGIEPEYEGEINYRDDSDGISIQNSERIVVRNCIANFNGEDGIDVGGYGQDGRENRDIKHIRITNCVAKNNYDDGLCSNVTRVNAHGGEDVTFANNLSVNNVNAGMTCYSNSVDVNLVHNTVVGNRWALHLRDNPINFNIKNNIFCNSDDSNFNTNNTNPDELTISNNNWFGGLPAEDLRGSNYQQGDPRFEDNISYTLSNDSPLNNSGTAITRATNSGNGKTIKVGNSKYFCDGFGVVSGDVIDIAGQQVEIKNIPDGNTLIVSEAIRWNEGDDVNFIFSGENPHLGYKANFEASNPPTPTVLGDVNCDGEVSSVDALILMQYVVGQRSESLSCPLSDPATQIYVDYADVDDSGRVDVTDALLILQCTAGVSNEFCPNEERISALENSTLDNKRLTAYPTLFQNFVTVQYESEENSTQAKMAFITNINNQVVREIEIPNQASWSTVLNVADLSPGLYMMTLIDGMHYETLKLIKN